MKYTVGLLLSMYLFLLRFIVLERAEEKEGLSRVCKNSKGRPWLGRWSLGTPYWSIFPLFIWVLRAGDRGRKGTKGEEQGEGLAVAVPSFSRFGQCGGGGEEKTKKKKKQQEKSTNEVRHQEARGWMMALLFALRFRGGRVGK